MLIERVDDFSELFREKEGWDALVSAHYGDIIFLTFDWFSAWWKWLSEGYKPSVLLARHGGRNLTGIAPLMQRGRILRFMASPEVTDYCDFITTPSLAAEFFACFCKYLRDEDTEIQILELINIPSASQTLTFLPEAAQRHGFEIKRDRGEDVPVLDIPQDYETYARRLKRKQRHELRRKIKRALRLPEMRHLRITDPGGQRAAMKAFMALHASGSPEKARFWEKPGIPEFFQELGRAFFEDQRLKLDCLYSGEKPVAALLLFDYGDSISFYNAAHDPDYAGYNPGYYLFEAAIRDAIAQGKSKVDFLRGGEKYKFEFGAQKSTIWTLNLNTGVREE